MPRRRIATQPVEAAGPYKVGVLPATDRQPLPAGKSGNPAGQPKPKPTIIPEWHHHAIAYQLDRVVRGDCKRLIINLPPRSLKSITVSVAWPLFLLGHDPNRRIICVSYSQELSRTLANQFRAVINTDWYKNLFPETIVSTDTQDEVALTARGGRLAPPSAGR